MSIPYTAENFGGSAGEDVRLIDDSALVELMARHGIGLREKQSYVVYEVDPAWSIDQGLDE